MAPRFADADHPAVVAIARRIAAAHTTSAARVDAIVDHVAAIPFGFRPHWDRRLASQVLHDGVGVCTSKSSLVVALCRAAGIRARVRAATIDLGVMRGFFPALPGLPHAGAHAWVEIDLDGTWHAVDRFVLDVPLQRAARARLHAEGARLGYGLALAGARPGVGLAHLDRDAPRFVQMAAVREDHGPFEDVAAFVASPAYRPPPAWLRPFEGAVLAWVNRRIERVRADATGPGVR